MRAFETAAVLEDASHLTAAGTRAGVSREGVPGHRALRLGGKSACARLAAGIFSKRSRLMTLLLCVRNQGETPPVRALDRT